MPPGFVSDNFVAPVRVCSAGGGSEHGAREHRVDGGHLPAAVGPLCAGVRRLQPAAGHHRRGLVDVVRASPSLRG